jgi:hypothetical protein
MKRALLTINVLFGAAVIIVSAFAAKEALVLKYGQGDMKSRPMEALKAFEPRTLSEYASIPESGLFGKGAIPSAGSEAGGSEPSLSGLVLVGTAEGVGYAIFMDTATGKQKAFKMGESVFGGAAIASIGTKKAELSSGSKRFAFSVPFIHAALRAAWSLSGAERRIARARERAAGSSTRGLWPGYSTTWTRF